MQKKTPKRCSIASREAGFTLLEVLISVFIVTIGLLGLLGVLGVAMAATQNSEELSISKRLANEALESILTARETDNVDWTQIANGTCNIGQTCGGGNGVFVPGPQPINNPGVDGVVGTNDDAAAGPQILDLPGPSGVIATPAGKPCAAPDNCMSLTNFTRTIAISPFGTDQNLDTVTITVTYTDPALKTPQNYVLSTLISQYR
jgi:type IV pilus assembly protein PilV